MLGSPTSSNSMACSVIARTFGVAQAQAEADEAAGRDVELRVRAEGLRVPQQAADVVLAQRLQGFGVLEPCLVTTYFIPVDVCRLGFSNS